MLHGLGGGFDRLVDLLVAGAAAEVAGDRLADSFAGRIGLALEQGFRGHQDARGAVAALRRSEVGKSGLQRMQLGAAGKAFHGLDAAPLALHRQHEAGELRLAVEQYGAGAALAELAAVLGAGEGEVLAQDLEQRLVRGEGRLHRLAVDAQIQLHVALHRRFQIVRTPNKLGPTLLPKPLWRTGSGQRYDFFLTPYPSPFFPRRANP